ncbi:hypothetical protein GCM10023321_73340 [Pseudonocardia eucalypti]|uniref:Uncharacterized protein n=1 Tax=Pseudonocardia eucalypti TaxID=648755 RepID=A0ABP9R7Y0_9PSEU
MYHQYTVLPATDWFGLVKRWLFAALNRSKSRRGMPNPCMIVLTLSAGASSVAFAPLILTLYNAGGGTGTVRWVPVGTEADCRWSAIAVVVNPGVAANVMVASPRTAPTPARRRYGCPAPRGLTRRSAGGGALLRRPEAAEAIRSVAASLSFSVNGGTAMAIPAWASPAGAPTVSASSATAPAANAVTRIARITPASGRCGRSHSASRMISLASHGGPRAVAGSVSR